MRCFAAPSAADMEPEKEGLQMKILAFDQATVKTGCAVFARGRLSSHGLIDLKRTQNAKERTARMADEICRRIETEKPDAVVIEDTAMQTNVSVLRTLAQLQGMILGFCFAQGIPCHVRKPSEWRKILGFRQGRVKSAELKKQAQALVKTTYQILVTEDEADAICIGLAFCLEKRTEDDYDKISKACKGSRRNTAN